MVIFSMTFIMEKVDTPPNDMYNDTHGSFCPAHQTP